MAPINQPSPNEAVKSSNLADHLTITVFEINGHSLVSGLLWEKLDKPRSYMAEARARGKAYGMDIVAIRESNTATQAGFAPKNRGAYKGMYSFAHVMADILGDNCLAVFALPNERYALFAVLDGSIVPGSDIVGDRETIEQTQNKFRNLVAGTQHQWKRMIAPEGFELSDETLALSDIITARVLKRTQQLRQLTFGLSPHEMRRLGLSAAAVIVVVGGALYAWHWHSQRLLLAQQEKEQQDAISNAKAIAAAAAAAHKAGLLAHPWASVPEADTVLSDCLPKLRKFPLSLGGWVLTSAKCEASGSLGAIYKRMGTQTVGDFETAATNYAHVPVVILDGAETAGVGGAFPIERGKDEDVPASNDARNGFSNQFQALGISVPLVLVPVPPTPPNQKNPAPMPDWQTYSFEVKTTLDPGIVLTGLSRAGLRITELNVQFDEGSASLSWTITGDQYAR